MQKVFLALADMSIVSSLVIAAVLLVRTLLRRAPRRFSYVLWAAVLVRLLCPFAVESPLSLIPERAGELAQSAALPESEKVTFASAASAAYRSIGGADGGRDVIVVGLEPGAEESSARDGGQDAGQYVHASRGQVWLLLCAWLWPAGTAAVLAWGVVGQLKLRRMLVGAVRLEGNVWLADHIPTAFVMGLLRPKIYLPSGLDSPGREYVIEHERAHIRRSDHITRLLAFAALALHWFNPLVWLAFALSGRDMEMSCDEAVMRRSGADIRADYCQTLLDMSANKHFPSPCLLAFGESDTGARVRNALKWRKPALWAGIGAMVLIVTACVLLLTNPAGKDANTAVISFPAYQDGRSSGSVYDPVYDFGPFTVSLDLPRGWTVSPPDIGSGTRTAGEWDTDNPAAGECPLYTPLYLYDGKGQYAGFIGWSDFDVYTEDDVPEGDYYKTVYYALRLGAHYAWTDFELLKSGESGETHTATVYWQEQLDDVPAAAWPQHTAPGICSYDRDLGVYVCVQLDEAGATGKEIRQMADSLSLSLPEQGAGAPSEGGAVGIGFDGYFYDGNTGKRTGPGPFTVLMELPSGWTVSSDLVREGGSSINYPTGKTVYLYDELNREAGVISCHDIDPESEYPLVRAGSWSDADYECVKACREIYYDGTWRDFQTVSFTGTAGSFTAGVHYNWQENDENGYRERKETRYGAGRFDNVLGVYVAIELYPSRTSADEAEAIAASLDLQRQAGTLGGVTELVVPGYYAEAGQVFECPAFGVSVHLPEGWEVVHGAVEPLQHGTFGMHPMTYMYTAEGDYAGFIAWDELSHLWQANHYLWQDLKQMSNSGGTDVYTAKITYDEWDESLLPEHPWKSFDTLGIRAENAELGVYAVVQFAPGAGSEEELEKMARSINFSQAESLVAGFGGLTWGSNEEQIKTARSFALLDGEPLRGTYYFNGRECTAYYDFSDIGKSDRLVGGEYRFNDEHTLTRDELAELYAELLKELTDVHGKPLLPQSGETARDLQAFISGESDRCADTWPRRAPDGSYVSITLELDSQGNLNIRYSASIVYVQFK